MRIAIDAMGGDHAPDEIIQGAIDAAPLVSDTTLLLVGRKDRLTRADLPRNIEIVHASEVVGMDEDPKRALLGKPDSSLRVSLRLVKKGEADAAISAGNTGALVGGATVPHLGLGNLEGVKRPGIAIPYPSKSGTGVLIDAGANKSPKPLHLVQYAVMGAVYIKHLRPEVKRPRVGLINIGEEANKGTDLIRQTYSYLEKAEMDFEFVGNVEPHKMFQDKTDVLVCDGFTGNLLLKMAEGVTKFIMAQFSNGHPSGAAILEDLRKATEKLDYSEAGGAPLLGTRGLVIKAHGRSKAKAITNAIKLAEGSIRGHLNDHIVEELRKVSSGKWFTKLFSWSKDNE